jgi:hypothetical protein
MRGDIRVARTASTHSKPAGKRNGIREHWAQRGLWQLLRSYANYYNQSRTHLSLNKDAPVSRAIQTVGRILLVPILGGLHHQYVRI